MVKRDLMADYTFNQKGAITTLLVIAICSLTLLWINLVTPSGTNTMEITFLGSLTAMFWILVPLCLKRIRWSWAAGIIVYLGLFIGAGIEAKDRVLFFSWSAYNVSILLLYVIALVGMYFSFRSIRELPQKPWKNIILGVSGIVIITLVIGATLWSNSISIERFMAQSTIGNIDKELQKMDTLEEKIQYLVAKGNIPSLVAGIVVDDSLVWNRGWGASAVNTIYPIDSISKTFTSTAILQLYDRNLIDLDEDVNKYLTFNIRHPEYPNKAITIRMLLSHQSGLSHETKQHEDYVLSEELLDWESKNIGRKFVRYDPNLSLGEFLEGLLIPNEPYYSPDVWSSNEPGTKYAYSNIGYDLLGYICGRITNQTFIDYLQENILDPLNMTNTVFSVSDIPHKQAVPYERVFGILSKTNVQLPTYGRNCFGAGGIRSTVLDLAKFMIAHMNQGKIDGFQLLKPETVALMHEREVSVVPGYGDTFQVGEGLGWTLLSDEPWYFWGNEYNMRGAMGHGGSNPGSRSSMWFVEGEKGSYGIIVMTNHKETFKPDYGLYFYSIYAKIQELLLTEAYEKYTLIS